MGDTEELTAEQDAIRIVADVLEDYGISAEQFQAWLAPLNKTVPGKPVAAPPQSGPDAAKAGPGAETPAVQAVEGKRTKAEIKALFQNGVPTPAIDKVRYPELVAKFAGELTKFGNQRAGVSGLLDGGKPDDRPLGLNQAFDDLVAAEDKLRREVADAIAVFETKLARDAERIGTAAKALAAPDGAQPDERKSLDTAVGLVTSALQVPQLNADAIKNGDKALLAATTELDRIKEKIEERRKEQERIAAEKRRREEALATEPARNLALTERIQVLSKGGFAVKYLQELYPAVKAPAKGDKLETIDARETARTTLAEAVTVAEAFKLEFAKLKQADLLVKGMQGELRDGFLAARPDVPGTGIATEDDLKKAKANMGLVAAWAGSTERTGPYNKALADYTKAWGAETVAAWPALAATAVADRISRADTKAGELAKAGGAFDEAELILSDGLEVIKAGSRYVTVLSRVRGKQPALPAELAPLSRRIDALVKVVGDNAAPSAKDFEDNRTSLTDAEALIGPGTTYVTTLKGTREALAGLARLVTPATKAAAATEDKALRTDSDAAVKLAEGLGYADATVALTNVSKRIADAATVRRKAVADRAGAVVEGTPTAKAVFGALGDSKDVKGNSLAVELYLQFGETDLPRLLSGLTGAKPGAAPGSADATGLTAADTAANLKSLGASVGAEGLKALTTAFGGSAAGAFGGADMLGQAMKQGMKASQVGDLHGAFGLGAPPGTDGKQPGIDSLKQVFTGAFSGDPQMFAAVTCGGLKGPKQTGAKPEDKCAKNLKALTDAFSDPVKLKTLITGVTSDDKATVLTNTERAALTDKEKATLKQEQCAAGAKRMDTLLCGFAGDAAKLKTPFFDTIEASPGSDAWKKVLIRAAGSFEAKPAPGSAPNVAPAVCTADDAKHFEERHCRMHATMKPKALAVETTTLARERKVTTLWPEGCKAADVKALVEAAKTKAGMPPGAWATDGPDVKTLTGAGKGKTKKPDLRIEETFYTQDVDVDYKVTVAGKDVTKTFGVRLGMVQTKKTLLSSPPGAPKTTYELTQFYPKSNVDLDTIDFDSMHVVKKALAR